MTKQAHPFWFLAYVSSHGRSRLSVGSSNFERLTVRLVAECVFFRLGPAGGIMQVAVILFMLYSTQHEEPLARRHVTLRIRS
jgi:hypothetical protein